MTNTYVNKVQKSNGEVLIDISDSTAVASDVASGKYFYLATGEKVAGTASGSGGYDNLSGSITVPTRTQSITIDPKGTRRYFLLVTTDRVLKKGLGYKACSLVFIDFDENITSYITTNNSGSDTMGYQGALTDNVNKVTVNGTAITLSSNATTSRTFGYFVDTSYDWFAFDEIGNSGQEPSGTIQITRNGTYNVRDYASAEVNVSGSGLVTQDSNGYIILSPTGGGGSGIPLLDVITVSENVRAVNLDLTPYHSYDEVFIISDVTLSASDWLYIVDNGSSPSGGTYTQSSMVNHKGLLAYMGIISGAASNISKRTGHSNSGGFGFASGYLNNLYIYTYVSSKTILAGSKFYIYGGTYANILQ